MKLIYLKSALKCDSFDVAIDIKIHFLEFWLLLSRVAPYYSSLPQTVWYLDYNCNAGTEEGDASLLIAKFGYPKP